MSLVKLQIYEQKPNEIIIEQFEAQEFESFVIVLIDMKDMDLQEAQAAIANLNRALENTKDDKQYIVVDKDTDISILGVVPAEQETLSKELPGQLSLFDDEGEED